MSDVTEKNKVSAYINEHTQDGSLPHTALSVAPHGQLDDRQTIDDHQILLIIANVIYLPFKPSSTLKTFVANGQKYSRTTLLNVLRESFPPLPEIAMMKWMLYDGKPCAFVCSVYKIRGYEQQL